ncbi:MAG: RNA polymerase sigma factor [Bacteroidaceae bacterium]|nr:RNA polymerase sigma factor [Bacteroidaceae bacterium]
MNDEEFMQAWYECEKALMSFALKLTGNIQEAEELHQSTIYRAYIKRNTYKKDISKRLWFMAIMRNIFINQRRCNEQLRRYIEYSAYNALPLSCDAPNGELFDILRALRMLPRMYLLPMQMFLSGFRYNEIAKALGLPLSTVKNRIHMARKHLKNILAPYDH